ncbi:allantoate deiminase [Chloropicon primus]|uniref:Allantoate deiminase n=2 Tax=Chloropicon primus TaxID=1764295 RepID=A0A5B8MLV7_9CHLO|nr:allantoate deiminase [Chloropicon primus]UPR00649.1 allantoate deiminase [Chloropicon primus]|eukprot:QDZ21437.1 allantoate deiminase [Chloropicon primus]
MRRDRTPTRTRSRVLCAWRGRRKKKAVVVSFFVAWVWVALACPVGVEGATLGEDARAGGVGRARDEVGGDGVCDEGGSVLGATGAGAGVLLAGVSRERDENLKMMRTFFANANMTNSYLDELAGISDSDFHLERTFLSPGSLRALASVRRWMEEAGLRVWLDSVGNLHGRLERAGGAGAGAEGGKTGEGEKLLLLGSHIDTVVDGGAYDGTLGIVAAITAVKNLKLKLDSDEGLALKRPVEVIAFSDEEGLRFKSTFLGSRAVSGTFLKHGYLDARDSKGYTLSSVLETVGLSNSKEDIAKIAMKREELYGYVEVHIEQGPVLQSLNQPVGVVSAISGQTRLYVQVDGFSGHAGTVPMDQRRDTIAASAEMIHRIEKDCKAFPLSRENMLVCTVGEFNVFPGASNVIAGYSNFSIDIRCKDDTMREEVVDLVRVSLKDIAARRSVDCNIETKHNAESCQSSPVFTESLRKGIIGAHSFAKRYEEARQVSSSVDPAEAVGGDGKGKEGESSILWEMDEASVPVIASGAGHDALAMSEVTPIGMLFVRCRDGISHSPLEFVEPRDVTIASLSLFHFLVAEALVDRTTSHSNAA